MVGGIQLPGFRMNKIENNSEIQRPILGLIEAGDLHLHLVEVNTMEK